MSSTEAPSKPRSEKTVRATSISCSRRSAAVIRLRTGFFGLAGTRSSCQRALRSRRTPGSLGAAWGLVVASGGLVEDELALDPLGHRPADVVHPADLLQRPDHAGRGVQLPSH